MIDKLDEKPRVMYVDDEYNNLVSFKAAFRLEFDIRVVDSGDNAMETLKSFSPHVIISDYRMPGRTGVDLFEEIKALYPDPLRVLLTAYGDTTSLTDAINRGQVFRYIKKPWSEVEIRQVIKDAYAHWFTQNELQRKNEEIIAAYKDLDRFVYSVSHDIRSPLMGILSVSNLISKSSKLEEILEYNDLIQRNVNRLDEFVHNLLEYYKVKRGSLTIVPIDFRALLKELTDIYSSEFMARNIHLDSDVNQDEEFRSDKLVLQIALQNFISNALKYQREDNPFKLLKLRANVSGGEALVTIEDNGIGIEPEYLNRIFDMFFRASTLGNGSGIGLYNAKQALDKLNAMVEVKSVPGEGTLFEIRLHSK